MRPHPPLASSCTPTLPAIVSPEFLAILRAHGVAEAFLFGSVARGDARPESDVDLLVIFAHPTTFFEQLELAEELERRCGRKVDLVTKLDPAYEPYIMPTLVRLPV